MSVETTDTRTPPAQLTLKLKRVLGGRAGWSGVAVQIVFVIVLAWMGYEIIVNARDNLEAQRIASGFGFLKNTAGFDVSVNLIPYSQSDTYTRVFLVGLCNTLLVAVVGIFLATILGFLVALGRLSPSWLMARVAGAFVEIVPNLPLLFQMLFWYLAVLAVLPAPRQSISPVAGFFLNNRGLIVSTPVPQPGLDDFALAILLAVVGSLVLHRYARHELYRRGRVIKTWPWVLGLFIGLPLLTVLVFGVPLSFDWPVLKGFNFVGGSRMVPEFVALTLSLTMYTAAFIAEIVRAGILAVHKGQMEAGLSLGLSRARVLRLIVVPQALRGVLAPLTHQDLNL